jgi:hypothetical protein
MYDPIGELVDQNVPCCVLAVERKALSALHVRSPCAHPMRSHKTYWSIQAPIHSSMPIYTMLQTPYNLQIHTIISLAACAADVPPY